MNKINELSYDEFKELTEYLNKEEDDANAYIVSKRLANFMPDLNSLETLLLENTVSSVIRNEEDSEEVFNTFKEKCGEKTFDKTGKSENGLKRNNIELNACEMIYETAESKLKETDFVDKTPFQVNLQVYNARTLDNLIKQKGKYEYPIKKALYFKNQKVALTRDELEEIEAGITQIFGSQKTTIMGNFLNYIYNKKIENVYYFIQHFKTRVLALTEDPNRQYPEDEYFYHRLEQFLESEPNN